MGCGATFSLVRRRHHCRSCGRVFCAKCSPNQVSHSPSPSLSHLTCSGSSPAVRDPAVSQSLQQMLHLLHVRLRHFSSSERLILMFQESLRGEDGSRLPRVQWDRARELGILWPRLLKCSVSSPQSSHGNITDNKYHTISVLFLLCSSGRTEK